MHLAQYSSYTCFYVMSHRSGCYENQHFKNHGEYCFILQSMLTNPTVHVGNSVTHNIFLLMSRLRYNTCFALSKHRIGSQITFGLVKIIKVHVFQFLD